MGTLNAGKSSVIAPPFWTPRGRARPAAIDSPAEPDNPTAPTAAERRRRSRRRKNWFRRRCGYRAGTGIVHPPLTQVPAPWEAVRRAVRLKGHRHRIFIIGAWLAYAAAWALTPQRRWPAFRLTAELTAVAVVTIGFFAFAAEFNARQEDREAREEDRINRAWTLIAAAPRDEDRTSSFWTLFDTAADDSTPDEDDRYNIGLREALETLATRDIDLSEIYLPDAYLREVSLPGAVLTGANLSDANLASANLSGAVLVAADLSDAVLWEANLSGALLVDADLSGANLWSADLSGAVLGSADLSGASLWRATLSDAVLWDADLSGAFLDFANLSGAHNLTADQIEAVQRICRTTLPDDTVSYRDCPDEAPDDHTEPLGPRPETP